MPPAPGTPRSDAEASVELLLERPVAEGKVLGHDSSGRVVLASGGIAGERVVLEPRRRNKRVLIGSVIEVTEPSPFRVEPPCEFVAQGCGGCDLQHVARSHQGSVRREVVLDALSHLGRFSDDDLSEFDIVESQDLVPVGDRTTVRMVVDHSGALGFRRAASHDPITVGPCLVAHELLQEPIELSRFPGADEVVLRASAAQGDVLAVVSGRHTKASRWVVPDGVRAISADDRGASRAWITEVVAGHELRVSARSFFQSGPVAAGALAATVARGIDGHDLDHERLVDLYGGVGLFTVLLGARNAEVVERAKSAVSDAQVNTAPLGSRVTRSSIESWTPTAADVVIADPARSGLGAAGVEAIRATGARRVVLVSCDPAAMARDLSQLVAIGYRIERIEIVDVFPHTHHVEAVSTLVLRPEGRIG